MKKLCALTMAVTLTMMMSMTALACGCSGGRAVRRNNTAYYGCYNYQSCYYNPNYNPNDDNYNSIVCPNNCYYYNNYINN